MHPQRRLKLAVFPSGNSFRSAVFMLALVALSLGVSSPAFAQCTDSWTGGGGDGAWSDVLNWSNGSEPGSNDNVCIQSGAAVLLDVGDDIANLSIGSGNSLTFPTVTNGSPSLNINGSSLTNGGQIILSAPVSFGSTGLSFSSSGTVTLSGNGTITLNANSFGSDFVGGSAKLVNQSTIQGAGGFDMTFSNASAGVINANASGAQLVVGRNQNQGGSSNTGLIGASNGGQLVMGSLALNNVGGTIQASGTGSFVTFADQGQGGQTITGGTFKTSGGGVINATNSTTTIDGTNGNTVTNLGTLVIPDQGAHPGALFQGTLNNKGTLQILSKGDGLGLNIPGGQTFTLTGTGSLTMGDGTANAYNNQNFISGATFVNQQLVQGTGNILNLTGFNNSGIINANVPTGTNNLQLQLGRAGASTNTGTIEASNGGALLIGSTTINNVGGTIAATGANSYVDLVGSLGGSGLTITGGTFNSSGGGVIYGQGGSLLDGTTSTVNNAGTMIINNQDLQAQGTLNNAGTIQILAPTDDNGQVFLQIPNGENLTVTGAGSIVMGDGTDNSYNNNAAIGNNLGTNGIFINNSTVTGTGQIGLTAGVTNNGVMNANVPVGGSGLELFVSRIAGGVFLNNGTIEATKGGKFGFDPGFGLGGNFTNAGTLTAAANSTIDLTNGDFTNLAGGTLTGGTYNVTGELLVSGNIDINAAKITLTGAASQILNPSTNALAGFVTNTSKGIFILQGGQTFTSAGTFTNHGGVGVLKGSVFTVGAGGSYVQSGGKTLVDGELTVSNAEQEAERSDSGRDPSAGSIEIAKGTLYGGGGNIVAHLYSAGTILPGNSPTSAGQLLVTGAYTQTAAGTLDSNIGGTKSGQFSQLNVNGTASLSGTLNIALLNSFVPAVGATFEVIRARHVTGTFATVNGTAINGNEHFTVTYNSENVTLTVVSGT